MERLTIQGFKFDANYIASHLQSFPIAQALNRLSAYEDTGITPAEVTIQQSENAGLRAEFDRVSNMTPAEFLRWKDTVEACLAALQRYTLSGEEKPLFPGADYKTRIDALSLVDAERNRQDSMWGVKNHNHLLWCSILTEEVGEYAQAVNETVFDNGADERKKGGYSNLMRELTHVAAVAVAAMECLIRNKTRIEEGGPT